MKTLFWLVAVFAAAVAMVILGRVDAGYVLFVYRDSGRLMVDNCGNSGLMTEKTEVLRGSGQHREDTRRSEP